MRGEFVENLASSRPIDRLPDMFLRGQSLLGQSADAYYTLSELIHIRIDHAGETGEALSNDILNCIALREMLRSKVLDEQVEAYRVLREIEMSAWYDERLGRPGAMNSIESQAQHLSPEEVLDYFLSK